MNTFLTVIGLLGTGSIITTVIQHFLNKNSERDKLSFSEKKEAFIGLIKSWDNYERSKDNSGKEYDVGHWFLRSYLVSSKETREKLDAWKNTTPGSNERIKATKILKDAMVKEIQKYIS